MTLKRQDEGINPNIPPPELLADEVNAVDIARLRVRRIKLAVITSIGSKITTIILQVLAFPVAIRTLGAEKFGVYVTLTATLAWMSMASIGIGPGLTRSIALSAAKGDRTTEAGYFSSAFFLITGIAFILLFILVLLFWTVPVESLYGAKYRNFTSDIQCGLFILGIFLSLQLMFSVTESAQAGYQEQYINNCWGIFGNTLNAILLFVLSWLWPTITGMIIANYGAAIVSKLLNGMCLVTFSRPYLMPRFERFDFTLSKGLLSTGLAFLLAQLSMFLNQQLSIFILGRILGPESVTGVAVMFQIVSLAAGIVVMFTQPLWPALIDAVTRDDVRWIRRSYHKAITFSTLYSIVVGLTLAVAGQPIVQSWIGAEVLTSIPLQVLTGLYFVLAIWSHVHYMVLVGLGWLWAPAIVLLTESLLVIPLSVWLIYLIGNAGVAAGLCTIMSCVSAWILPFMTKRAIHQSTLKLQQLP